MLQASGLQNILKQNQYTFFWDSMLYILYHAMTNKWEKYACYMREWDQQCRSYTYILNINF